MSHKNIAGVGLGTLVSAGFSFSTHLSAVYCSRSAAAWCSDNNFRTKRPSEYIFCSVDHRDPVKVKFVRQGHRSKFKFIRGRKQQFPSGRWGERLTGADRSRRVLRRRRRAPERRRRWRTGGRSRQRRGEQRWRTATSTAARAHGDGWNHVYNNTA